MYGRPQLTWRPADDRWALYCVGHLDAVLHVVPDDVHPGMWRIRRPDGSLTDMANLTWARDGAISIALDLLNCMQWRDPRHYRHPAVHGAPAPLCL
jgi:hypothetical protein